MKYKCFFGDIHNHCNASYAHGSLEDALKNAMLQLDFVSVTGHSSWPDMPERKPPLESVVDYHTNGFDKLESGWDRFVETFDQYNKPGEFVCFPSYEIHSMADGDHTVYFKNNNTSMHKPEGIPEFQDIVRKIRSEGDDAFLVPHHIGYRTGYRGINWDSYDEETSPFVEIISMHGCSESDESVFPYLHTMGPRNGSNTMQAGLGLGHHFGVIGSTDHHSAHPGSHGYGRVAVWAEDLTKEIIWAALKNRRCYAITGDKIILEFKINDKFMGEQVSYTKNRDINLSVSAGDSLDYIEILKNNRVIKRFDYLDTGIDNSTKKMKGKVFIEFGWGRSGVKKDWDIQVSLDKGRVINVEPRLHGVDVVNPEQKHSQHYQFSSWEQNGNTVKMNSCTWGNPTTLTNANQGICLEIDVENDATLSVKVDNIEYIRKLDELRKKSDSFYLSKFLSSAVHIHRFIPEEHYKTELQFRDTGTGQKEDSYYVRVRQRNGQWAFSSPIWIGKRK